MGGERGGENIPVRFVDGEVEFFPAASSTQAVLGFLPLSGAADFKASAVHEDTHRLSGPVSGNERLKAAGTTGQCRMVGDGNVQTEEMDQGFQKAFGLSQREAVYRPDGQRSLDGQIRIDSLSSALLRAVDGKLGRDGLL